MNWIQFFCVIDILSIFAYSHSQWILILGIEKWNWKHLESSAEALHFNTIDSYCYTVNPHVIPLFIFKYCFRHSAAMWQIKRHWSDSPLVLTCDNTFRTFFFLSLLKKPTHCMCLWTRVSWIWPMMKFDAFGIQSKNMMFFLSLSLIEFVSVKNEVCCRISCQSQTDNVWCYFYRFREIRYFYGRIEWPDL